MSNNFIHFFCPNCKARIKAPGQLSGQRRNCPGCTHSLKVPILVPEDAQPIFVLLEDDDRFKLGVRYRTGGQTTQSRMHHSAKRSA